MNNALTITGLSREALTAAGVVRPVVTLSSLRLDAKHTGRAQVIAHADDAQRVIVVFPGGATVGTSITRMGWVEAEGLAASRGEYHVRMDEVAK